MIVIAIKPDFRPSFFQAGDRWQRLSQGEGVKSAKKELSLTSAEIGDKIGVQKTTVDGWTVGKPISAGAMSALNRLLAEKYGTEYQGVRPDKILR